LPDLFVDGQLTVTENVADMGGAYVAYEAMENFLDRTERPARIDGFTQEQRFFIAAAQVWRAKIRPEFLTLLVKDDPHAPASVRSVQPIRQMGAFHTVFDIRPSDPMYLPPDERVIIW